MKKLHCKQEASNCEQKSRILKQSDSTLNKSLCASFLGWECKKGTHIISFRDSGGSKKGVQKAQKFSFLFFPPLVWGHALTEKSIVRTLILRAEGAILESPWPSILGFLAFLFCDYSFFGAFFLLYIDVKGSAKGKTALLFWCFSFFLK